MTFLSRRLQRLEATTARLDPSARMREFEEFGRAAEEYMRAVHRYLGEPPDKEMTITCRNESEMSQVINQVVAYHIRSLRHYYHQRSSVGECWIGNTPPERRVGSATRRQR